MPWAWSFMHLLYLTLPTANSIRPPVYQLKSEKVHSLSQATCLANGRAWTWSSLPSQSRHDSASVPQSVWTLGSESRSQKSCSTKQCLADLLFWTYWYVYLLVLTVNPCHIKTKHTVLLSSLTAECPLCSAWSKSIMELPFFLLESGQGVSRGPSASQGEVRQRQLGR